MGSLKAHEVAVKRCTATSKSTGQQCRQAAVAGSTKCHYHGGRTPRGEASPHWRGGRHARHLVDRLLGAYGESLASSEQLESVAELALIDARVGDLLAVADSGESRAAWCAARAAAATVAAGGDDAPDALAALSELLAGSQGDSAAWSEIGAWVDLRRRLVDTEARAGHDRLIRVVNLVDLVGAIGRATLAHVTDPAAREAIAAELRRLLD